MLALSLAAGRPFFTRWTGYGCDVALLIVCLPVLQQRGLWNGLAVHWTWLPLYTVTALVMFLMSVQFTVAQPTAYMHRVVAARRTAPARLQLQWGLRAGATAVYEELIWRIVVQSLLQIVLPIVLAIGATSMLFTMWHRESIGNNVLLAVDLFSFSAIAGGLLIASGDPLSVVAAHTVRNHLIYLSSYPSGRN
jgi:membrane protease YdiL (CAAX protease family)